MPDLSAKLRIFTAFLIVSAALLYWGLVASPQENRKTPIQTVSSKIDYFVEQGKTKSWDAQGNLELKLSSTLIEHDPSQQLSFITSPNSKHYRKNNLPIDVTAQQGTVTDDNVRIDLAGNVVLLDNSFAKQPTTLTTEKLTIYQHDQYAETDQPVEINSESGNIEAVGMDIQFEDRIMNFHSQVKGIHLNAQ